MTTEEKAPAKAKYTLEKPIEETVLYEKITKDIVTITLNRPERLNAMTNTLFRDFRAAIDTAAADPKVVGIVVTGMGRAFSAGLDTDALAAIAEAGSGGSGGSDGGCEWCDHALLGALWGRRLRVRRGPGVG